MATKAPTNAKQLLLSHLAQHNRKDNNGKDHRQYEQQTTSLIPRIPLMSRRRPELSIRPPRIRINPLHILRNDIQLLSLLMHHVRHVPEQLVQLAHRLLDVPDLRLALDDQRLLEVDFVLRREAQLLLLLLLLLSLRAG